MTETLTPATTRRERRYSVTSPESTSVTVVVEDPEKTSNGRVYHGTVHDLSAKGMRLNLSVGLSLDAKVQIRFCVPDCGIDMLSSGVIRWQQTRDETTWWIGCLLDEPLSARFLLELASHQIIDRRQDERTPIDIPAKAKLELNSDPVDVSITNYSFGGCCLSSSKTYEVQGDRLLLVLTAAGDTDDKIVRIPLRIRWKEQQPDGFSIGCAFVSHQGYVALRDFLGNGYGTMLRQRCYKVSPIQFKGTWIAIALMTLFSLKIIELSSTDSKLSQMFQNGWQQLIEYATGENTSVLTIPVKKQENAQNLSH